MMHVDASQLITTLAGMSLPDPEPVTVADIQKVLEQLPHREVFCAPSRVDQLRAALDEQGLGWVKVSQSFLVDEDKVLVVSLPKGLLA